MWEAEFKLGMTSEPSLLCGLVPGRHWALGKGRAQGSDDHLPGGLVSFDFLLTGFLESPLSLFSDTQDTSVFVPGEKGHRYLRGKQCFVNR